MDVGDRGQAHTVEAVSAAIVLLASVVFALQVTAVTPLTASTASQHIENQQAGVGGGVLDEAAETGSLKRTLLYWNEHKGEFHGASSREGIYTLGGPPTEFGERLNETFLDRGIAFDLVVTYSLNDQVAEQSLVDLGKPSDNAVSVERTVALYDSDNTYDADETRNTSVELGNSKTFYTGDDQSPHSPVYNVVRVELTLWRM